MKPLTALVRLVIMTVVLCAALFLIAGTWDWPAAWGYLAVVTLVMSVYLFVVLPMHPGLADERRNPPTDAKRWDRPFVAVVAGAGPVSLIVLSALDRRFHWSVPPPAWAQAAGLLAGLAGGMFTNYAVAENRFFSGLVRIQRDRGHQVVQTGPYRLVRHPGYLGSLVYMLGVAIGLGSRPALIATLVVALVLVVRTSLEDRTLQAELDGYAAYAARVRHRLIPGVW